MSPADDKGAIKPRARRTRASAAAEPETETKTTRAKAKTKTATSRKAAEPEAEPAAKPARRTAVKKRAAVEAPEPEATFDDTRRDNRDPEVGEYDRSERRDDYSNGRSGGRRNGQGGGGGGYNNSRGGAGGFGGNRGGGGGYGGGGNRNRHGGGNRGGGGGYGGPRNNNSNGGGDRRNSNWQDRPRVQRPPVDPVAAAKKATEVLDFLAKRLVTKPDNVIVELFADEEDRPVIELIVDKEDIGKVIGRNGRVAHALRTLVRATAETRISVDILDSEEAAEDALEGADE